MKSNPHEKEWMIKIHSSLVVIYLAVRNLATSPVGRR
jgi:hypothetical protein